MAYCRSLLAIGLQIGSPSRLTRTAAVLLKNTVGGSALTPSTFFGMISLLSRFESTRSSAMTRSSCGMPLSSVATTSCSCAFSSVGKFDSTILITEKFTRRSLTETLVSASTLTVPEHWLVTGLRGVRHRRVRRSPSSDSATTRSAAGRERHRRRSRSCRSVANRRRQVVPSLTPLLRVWPPLSLVSLPRLLALVWLPAAAWPTRSAAPATARDSQAWRRRRPCEAEWARDFMQTSFRNGRRRPFDSIPTASLARRSVFPDGAGGEARECGIACVTKLVDRARCATCSSRRRSDS